jgi:hypothetical protein
MAIGHHVRRVREQQRQAVIGQSGIFEHSPRSFDCYGSGSFDAFLAEQRKRIATSMGWETRHAQKRRDDRWHLESRSVETKHFELERGPVITRSVVSSFAEE